MDDCCFTQPFPGLPKPKMTSYDTYSPKTTSICYPWPKEVTGIERIALSAQGDLQRILSAFFGRPISVALVYSQTTRQQNLQAPFEAVDSPSPAVIASASPSSPILQTRQVQLQCAGKTVCTATSTVRITSPECAHLFLQERYAIGQMFRRLEKVPAFELLSVGLGPVKDVEKQSPSGFVVGEENSGQLWRKYTLVIPHFECEILEVFPSREMFALGEKWLTRHASGSNSAPLADVVATDTKPFTFWPLTIKEGLNLILLASFALMIIYEALFRVDVQC